MQSTLGLISDQALNSKVLPAHSLLTDCVVLIREQLLRKDIWNSEACLLIMQWRVDSEMFEVNDLLKLTAI